MMIRLPLIREWSYHSSPSDSMPILAKDGVLVNLDTVGYIKVLGEDNTSLGGGMFSSLQIPLSLEDIQRAWAFGKKELLEIDPHGEPIACAPSWEGKFSHQMKLLPYSQKPNPNFKE